MRENWWILVLFWVGMFGLFVGVAALDAWLDRRDRRKRYGR